MAKTHFSGPLVVGTGDETGAPGSGTVEAPVAVGTNIAGVDLLVQGGQSTGSGAGGAIRLQVSPAGSSGSTPNAMVDGLVVPSTGGPTFGPAATAGQVIQARVLSLVPTAAANTDLTIAMPRMKVVRITERTMVAYAGSSTVTVQVGATAGGSGMVAASDIKTKAAARALTLVDSSADALDDYPAGTLHVRIAQAGTPSATGEGELIIEYIAL